MARMQQDRIMGVGHLPPPVNGLTLITSRLISSLGKAGYHISFINTGVATRKRSVFFHARRLAKTLRVMLWIAWNGMSGASRVCYFTAEGGLGLIYSVMIAGCAALFCSRVYIHHHSYSYIVHSSRLMRLVLAWSSSKAIHVCLCSGMAQSLADRYKRPIPSLILSNAAFVDPGSSRPPMAHRQFLVIGLLSNLTSDKGLYEFLDIVRLASRRGLPIRAVLAGPVGSEKDRSLLEATRNEVGEYLDYRGPVYGDDKSRFFADIDVFVFLTTYLNEAQPTVLFEAMSYGIPAISYDRGCIRNQIADAGFVLAQGSDVVSATVKALMEYHDRPEYLAKQKCAALDQFERQRRQGQDLAAKLFDASPTWFGTAKEAVG